MQRRDDPVSASDWCRAQLVAGRKLGFVPTMGALHEGHLSLVRRARAECGLVAVSVFVNPLQFNEARDFERYPRDFDGDARLLADAGCDLVFTGTLEQFFPESGGARDRIAWREPGASAEGLEGALRPGHFRGVATIVARLFELVRPTRAYFGEKDFQQTLVVRQVARELGYPTIVVCPTLREPSGLARSSRNELLSAEQRERAVAIHRGLLRSRALWREDGERRADALRAPIREELALAHLELEYAELRDPDDWTSAEPVAPLERAVALVAARAGSVRLIDNLRLDESSS
ncbi:MAG: pantoate--beta-alanine ligase [Planctomycetes bacterium]|nr:pantoate--beta-alanine ligase [Planctomycetota bacterium]